MTVTAHSSKVEELVRRLDAAVVERDDALRSRNVKQVLMDVIASSGPFLAPSLLAPAPDRYVRRLIHRDPAGRYTVIVMVWGRGQGTPLHDHAGMWCVECVYHGRIKVTSYTARAAIPRPPWCSSRGADVFAGPGEAGALIPPFEYHVLENAGEAPAVTIHVYGGEMTYCHVYEPVDGGHQRRFKELSYTD